MAELETEHRRQSTILIDVEEEINDRLDAPTGSQTRQPPSGTPYRDAPITNASLQESSVTLTCEVSPEIERDYTLTLPSSPDETSNSLARICRSQDIPITRVGNLTNLTVVNDEYGSWLLEIPSQRSNSRVYNGLNSIARTTQFIQLRTQLPSTHYHSLSPGSYLLLFGAGALIGGFLSTTMIGLSLLESVVGAFTGGFVILFTALFIFLFYMQSDFITPDHAENSE